MQFAMENKNPIAQNYSSNLPKIIDIAPSAKKLWGVDEGGSKDEGGVKGGGILHLGDQMWRDSTWSTSVTYKAIRWLGEVFCSSQTLKFNRPQTLTQRLKPKSSPQKIATSTKRIPSYDRTQASR
ncbi:hypothetical protein TSAR_013140 [Trichomalopsis sarcophagae]|uniref:Uncharacterized protein n=1 Tax=Trichomalopsis sarcophagae TaxID=543379 RepID=A0A232FI10_9HYME|nr:hypothetical protein TSAR_013140 [Trichomalopsis sarcophagae]